MLTRIKTSGLLQELQEKCMPESIILFGSAARGEDTELSDIDIYVAAKKSAIKADKYEKILQRKVNVLFEEHFKSLSRELRNNLLNGVILYGYVKEKARSILRMA